MNPTLNSMQIKSVETSLEAQTHIINNLDKIDIKSIDKLKIFIENNKDLLDIQIKTGLNILSTNLEKRVIEIKRKTSGILAFFIFLIWSGTKKTLLNEATQLSQYERYFRKFVQEMKDLQSGDANSTTHVLEPTLTQLIGDNSFPPQHNFSLPSFEQLQSNIFPVPSFDSSNLPPPPPIFTSFQNTLGNTLQTPLPRTQINFASEPDEPAILLKGVNLQKKPKIELDKEIIEIETFVLQMKNSIEPIQKALDEIEVSHTELKDLKIELTSIDTDINNNNEKIAALIEGENEKSDFTLLQFEVEANRKQVMPFYSDQIFVKISSLLINNGGKALENTFKRTSEIKITQKNIDNLTSTKNKINTSIKNKNDNITRITSIKNNGISFDNFMSLLPIKNQKLGKWERALTYRKNQIKILSTNPSTDPSTKPPQQKNPSMKGGLVSDKSHQLIKNPAIQKQIPEIEFIASFIENHDALLHTKINKDYHKKIFV